MHSVVSNAACCVLVGLIVGIIIRYGLDAEKHLFILDCWHNVSQSPDSELPTSVVVLYNNTEYFEYTNGRKVNNDYVAQPQFEDKVVGYLCTVLLEMTYVHCTILVYFL